MFVKIHRNVDYRCCTCDGLFVVFFTTNTTAERFSSDEPGLDGLSRWIASSACSERDRSGQLARTFLQTG